jgi:outer membrane protein assembly factor BamB
MSYPPPIPDGDLAVTYQNDVAHTGLENGDSLRPTLTRKWSVDLGGSVSYALIAQGMMYVTVADPPPATGSPHGAKLYALDQGTGQTVWGPYELGGSWPWANAAYDNGRVFALNVDGLMRAYDAKTGALQWSKQIPDPAGTTTCGCYASAPTAANGIVYTSGGGVAQVSALSESDGTTLWQQRVIGSDHSSPAVSSGGVYVTYACNQAYDFNPTTGAPVWYYPGSCSGGGGKTPVLNAGKLYARDQPFAANPIIDSQTGAQVGQFVSGVAPVIDGSIGLFFTNYNTLQARDLATNQVLWTFTEDRPSTAPIVVNGYVYLGTGVGTLYVLDEQTGRQVYYDYLWNGITGPDEYNVSAPLAGLTVGQGLLAVPAGNKLFVYGSSGNPPWPPPSFTPVPNTTDQSVMYQVNPQHNGDLPGAALVPPLTKSWSVDFGEYVSYPVAAQGLVFVATGLFNDNNHPFTHLYALKQDTGAIAWGPVPLELDVGDHWAALAYDAGRLFSLNSVGWLKAWDASNGRKLWAMQVPRPYQTVNAPPTAMNGLVYVTAGSGSGELFAIETSSGTLRWQQPVSNGQGSSPAVSAMGVYETFQCHQVSDFNPSSGAILWQHSDGTNCANGEVPVLANGRLYERDYLGTNELFNADSGAVLGSFAADGPPAADGSLVFLVTNAYAYAGTLEARDAATNALAWSFTGDGTLSTAPVVVRGVVYIGSYSGKLYALDGTSGKLLWSDTVGPSMRVSRGYEGGAPWQGMASAQGYFFVAAGNQLVAYRGSQTGPPPTPFPSPSPGASPNPLRTVPGSSPNPIRRNNVIPPAVPSCCGAFAPVRQLMTRMTVVLGATEIHPPLAGEGRMGVRLTRVT